MNSSIYKTNFQKFKGIICIILINLEKYSSLCMDRVCNLKKHKIYTK